MLLKVKCEKCNTKYKLDEARIQGRGAKITCPRCRNVFVVMKPKDAPEEAGSGHLDPAESSTISIRNATAEALAAVSGEAQAAQEAAIRTAVEQEVSHQVGPAEAGVSRVPSKRKKKAAGGERPAPDSLLRNTGPLSKAVKRPTNADTLDWKDVGVTTFKVKVAIGLVYDFSDVPTLKKYIAEKRVVSTDRVSFDGKVWTALKDINSLDEFFIDQWVALKLERMLEEQAEEEEAVKAGLIPPPSSREKPVFGDPISSAGRLDENTLFKPSPGPEDFGKTEARPARESKRAKAETPDVPVSNDATAATGLLGGDLFDDIGMHEEPSPAAPVSVPKNRPSRAASESVQGKGGAATGMSMPGRAAARRRRSEVGARFFDAMVLVLLTSVAGYLAWKYFDEGQRLRGAERTLVDPSEEAEILAKTLETHLPIAYAEATGQAELKSAPEPEVAPPPSIQRTRAAKPPRKKEATQPRTRRPRRHKVANDSDAEVKVSDITADDLYQAAIESIKTGDYGTAIQSLTVATQMSPASAKVHYMLGYALYKAGRLKQAEGSLNKTLTLRNHKPETYKWLGEVYSRQGQKEKAIKSFEQYLEGAPGDAPAIRDKIAELSNS